MLDQDCLLSLSGLRLIYVSLNRGYKCSKFAPPAEMQCFDRLYLFLTEDLNAPKLLPQLRCNALVACTSFQQRILSRVVKGKYVVILLLLSNKASTRRLRHQVFLWCLGKIVPKTIL